MSEEDFAVAKSNFLTRRDNLLGVNSRNIAYTPAECRSLPRSNGKSGA